MASTMVKDPNMTVSGFAGSRVNIPYYLQFVSGHVVDVVHSDESLRYKGENSINSIIAYPHYGQKITFDSPGSLIGEEFRYFPLLRGITDVPSKGDPVLLCTIGQINYYLGPINSITNNPTWNRDHLFVKDTSRLKEVSSDSQPSPRGMDGESLNFNRNRIYSRMTKVRKFELDYGYTPRETTGDTMIEGRHGNSIRLGSRSNKPYIFISNERAKDNPSERLADGSLISITSDGTLKQHFDYYTINSPDISKNVEGFTLASDFIGLDEETPNRYMEDLVYNVNGNENAIDNASGLEKHRIYDYTGNQILFHSDRITLNTKRDDIYLSSIKDIHIGTKRHLTISTNEDLIINSERTFVGNPTDREPLVGGSVKQVEDTLKDGLMQPMILGSTLLQLIRETLDVIKNSHGVCQGAPIKLSYGEAPPGGVEQKITQIEQKIEQILSTKHFIEPNP